MVRTVVDRNKRRDLFNALPFEIRELILVEVFSLNVLRKEHEGLTLPLYLARQLPLSNLRNAALASPALSLQLQYSRPKIIWDVIVRDLPKDILLDAIAFLSFPDPHLGSVSLNADQGVKCKDANLNQDEVVLQHLSRWSDARLPLTLAELGRNFVIKLDSYLRRISGYMEDFMYKTLQGIGVCGEHQQLSYVLLPEITHPELSPGSGRRARSYQLPYRYMHNWKTFLKGFLQYELICLIHRPRPKYAARYVTEEGLIPRFGGLRRLSDDKNPTPERPSSLPDSWDFTYLAKFQGKVGLQSKPWEVDRILSVFEYVASVYGAVFFHVIHQEDTDALAASRDVAILTGHCLRPHSCSGWRFLDRLSMNGLGCLDNLLRSNKRDFITAMRRFDVESESTHIVPTPRDVPVRLSWGMMHYGEPSRMSEGPEVWRVGLGWIKYFRARVGLSMSGRDEPQIPGGAARFFKRGGFALLNSHSLLPGFNHYIPTNFHSAPRLMGENVSTGQPELFESNGWGRPITYGMTFSLSEGRLVRKRDGKSRFKRKPLPGDSEWKEDEKLAEFPSLKRYVKPLWARGIIPGAHTSEDNQEVWLGPLEKRGIA